MKQKVVCTVLVYMILLSTILLTGVHKVKAEDTTVIHVDPSYSYAAVGENFSININIANVEFLWAWRFDLEWDTNLLEVPDDPETPGIVEGISEGPFLNQEGEFKTTFAARSISGAVSATCTLKGVEPYDAPSGNGTLANVTFLVKAEGECPLHFNLTRLIKLEGESMPFPVYIPHTSEDGYFKGPIPDINGDGIVDIVDVEIVALAFGSTPGTPNWNPDVDLNQDGIIDIVDVVMIAIHFGETV